MLLMDNASVYHITVSVFFSSFYFAFSAFKMTVHKVYYGQKV